MAEEATHRQLVVFSLGEEEYALPITQVQEIIRFTEPRAVASDAAWIRGVISLRGKIIPVCDLAARLGLVFDEPAAGKIVIVESGTVTAGVIVDEVEEVLTIEEGQVDDLPAAGSESIEGIAKIDDRLIVLLNTAGIFGELDLTAPAAA